MRKLLSLTLALTMILTLLIPAAMAAAPLPPEAQNINAVVSASVNKLNGNKNELTIEVRDAYDVFAETFLINNNAAGVYTVGDYDVYVNTKGNDQIRLCYIVSYNVFNTYQALLPSAINKNTGDIFQLCPVISILGFAANDLVWKSSNPSVAIVDQNGAVTCISSGTAVIKVTSASNQIYSECAINVTGSAVGWLVGSKSYTFTEEELMEDWIFPDDAFETLGEDGSIPMGLYLVKPEVVAPGQNVVVKAEVQAADGAGLVLGYQLNDGMSFRYLFRTTATDNYNGSNGQTNQMQFLNEMIAWGPQMPFTWRTGEWYWMMFEVSKTDNFARGKVWQGSEEDEPAAWTHSIALDTIGGVTTFRAGQPGVSNRTNTNAATGRYRNFTVTATDPEESSVLPIVISCEPRSVNAVYETEDVVVADYDITDIVFNTGTGIAKIDNTGVQDASDFIQAAIDACHERGGGTVWLPAGSYRVTKSINVSDYVTLRGDWNMPNPDGSVTGGDYGTLIIADVPASASGTGGLFKIATSAGCLGLTVWYPNQQVPNPTPYPFTFEMMPGVMPNVKNCTMLNSYRGIGICLGGATNTNIGHEMATVHNVYGTVLFRGLEAYNASEVDVFEWVYFDNKYWVQAGAAYNAPALTALNAYTLANTRGFIIADLEWGQMTELHANNYFIGLEAVNGARTPPNFNVDHSAFINCATAVQMTATSNSSYMLISRSTISGTTAVRSSYAYSLLGNKFYPNVQLTDCNVTGALTCATASYINNAVVVNPRNRSGEGPAPTEFNHVAWVVTKPAKADLFDVTKAPYNAQFTKQKASETYGIQAGLPTQDATAAIQRALDDAGANGGGVVYLPAGWYRIDGHLTVPEGVELRGSSSVAHRDTGAMSYGTVLMAYEGKKTVDWPAWGNNITDTDFRNSNNDLRVIDIIEGDPALVTLDGSNSGIRGIKIFWPENSFWPEPYAYPYAIRGNGANLYVVNVSFVNAFKGVDFYTNHCPDHYIRRISGITIGETIKIGSGSGKIEACLTNLTHLTRNGYNVPGWVVETGSNGWYPGVTGAVAAQGPTQFWGIFGFYTREYQTLISIDGADESLMDNFSYGARHGIHVKSGSALANTHGFDGNTHYAGPQIEPGGKLTVINFMTWSMYAYNLTGVNGVSMSNIAPSNLRFPNTTANGTFKNSETFTFYNEWLRRCNTWRDSW